MTRLHVGALAAVLYLPLAAPTSAPSAGPPWVSIEYPVNPYDATTRDAFLVVHAFHHGSPMAFPVSGTAEGLVNGTRRSIELTFHKASRPGEYALRKQWPDQGVWTLVIGVAQGPEDRVTALVDLSSAGEVARINVPTRKEGGHVIPARVAMKDVEDGLRSRAGK
jgi:hypothetical protein